MAQERLLGKIEGIEGTEAWTVEWRNKSEEGRVSLMLGRLVAGVKEKMLVRIDGLLWKICSSGRRGGNV